MLNYAYIVEAGRLAKALAANGLCLSIGYLHSDKKGLDSGAKRNVLKRSGFECPFQARQSRLGMAS
jgi:hypothetical protein